MKQRMTWDCSTDLLQTQGSEAARWEVITETAILFLSCAYSIQ